MGTTFAASSFLQLVFVHPVESVTTVAALVFINTYLIRCVISFRTKSNAKLEAANRQHEEQQLAQKRRKMAKIQSQLNALTFLNCAPQDQSPLFNTLPGELRNEVFRHALVQYEDTTKAYNEDAYWYRPSFTGPKKSNSALLRTCKLIFLEARRVIAREAEHAFWFDRGPEGRAGYEDFKSFFDGLNTQNVEFLIRVRFFPQMYWIESGMNLNKAMRHVNFQPETLTITFRYSDWWWWETNEPLSMDETWFKRFKGPASLKELVVEYETISWKREQMVRIIERNKKWKLGLRDRAGHLSAEHTALTEWKWQGPSKLGGGTWTHHGAGDKIEYVVVVDRWTWQRGDLAGHNADLVVESGTLDVSGDSDEGYDPDWSHGSDLDDENDDGQPDLEPPSPTSENGPSIDSASPTNHIPEAIDDELHGSPSHGVFD